MTVRQVLSNKGAQVVTISPDATLSQAAALLSEKRIGATVVSEDGRAVAGILSERDIIRAVAQDGAGALDAAVSRFMTRDVVTCSMSADTDHLMRLMTNGKFRHVPVVEDGVLAGIISIGDVVNRRLADIEAEQQALKDYIAAG
ncbi:MAG: CBS domain-containing protein [Salinarimonas sp.]|nr:CBS domain-containing protein [Salinarimonas sp.]